MMTFVIISNVIGLLWPDMSSWLHGNSTLRCYCAPSKKLSLLSLLVPVGMHQLICLLGVTLYLLG